MDTKFFQRGFTLLELLVVIAIIGILSSIVIVSLSDSRAEARNAQVISQMIEYQKALELYFAETGTYPSSGPAAIPDNAGQRNRIWCVGSGRVGGCLPIAQAGIPTFDGGLTHLEQVLQPNFIGEIVHITQSGGISSPAYRGCSDIIATVSPGNAPSIPSPGSNCTTIDYSIFFALEGANQDCGRAHLVAPDYNANDWTLCQLSSAQ
jgi:prepilin-type N-terminal cleavage/methylation domain-containing protein